MRLRHGLHLAYCTNVHPGETWAETLAALERWTLRVKEQVAPNEPYAIGLRLSDQAARELAEPERLLAFQRWLERHECYVFTLNGFPFGQFHGGRVKEQVYRPDWTDSLRLDYTNRLFDLLAELVPPEMEGSVSTLPGSFKEFVTTADQEKRIRENLWRCVEHIDRLCQRTGRRLHLGLEPEPLGLFENTEETVRFFDQIRDEHAGDPRLSAHLGVNYDTCHLAVEYEAPQDAVARFRANGVRLSKIHLSNALKLRPSAEALKRLAGFTEDVYLHQVIVRNADGSLARFRDLDVALARSKDSAKAADQEWRVHFHIPLHAEPPSEFQSTADHIIGLLPMVAAQPDLCTHLEMETYTWAVLPEPLKSQDVGMQLVGEYRWMLARLGEHGLVGSGGG